MPLLGGAREHGAELRGQLLGCVWLGEEVLRSRGAVRLDELGAVAGREERPEGRRVDLARDYAYVFADLGRIALIAGIMLVGLVALSFVLR